MPFLTPPFPRPALRLDALTRGCPFTGRRSPATLPWGCLSSALPLQGQDRPFLGLSLHQAHPNHLFPLRCAHRWVTFFYVAFFRYSLPPVMSVPDLGLRHSFLPSPFAGSPSALVPHSCRFMSCQRCSLRVESSAASPSSAQTDLRLSDLRHLGLPPRSGSIPSKFAY